MSLTEFGHGHGFNIKAEGGTVRYQPPTRERKIVWGPQNGGKRGRSEARVMAQRGKRGTRKRRNYFGTQA